MQAAQQGYIGFIIAKAGCCMGLPGIEGNLIGQAPIGFAFPTAEQWPVMMDICLAYAAGEHLIMKDRLKIPVPSYWGVDKGGNPTTDAGEILKGVKFPIGEHKGFGLALLAELLTGVLSGGAILDDGDEEEIYRGTSHTSFAIKADALMSMPEYTKRSQELIDRLRNRSEKIHVPGDSSWKNIEKFDQTGYMELDEDFIDTLNRYAEEYHVEGIQKGE
jgi:LDH2 family malate/lactate/ureidoglycolate dehydrogenase